MSDTILLDHEDARVDVSEDARERLVQHIADGGGREDVAGLL
jgi:hypothetical protein